MTLFTSGDFILHSGDRSRWIIDCSALTDDDWATLARMAAEILPPFRRVTGIPRGGLKFAAALQPYTVAEGQHLFADDVFTTGRSLSEAMAPLDIGIVVFSRGVRPINVMALWQAPDPKASAADIDFTGGKARRVHPTGSGILGNNGMSFGLQYPAIYGKVDGAWLVWNRHTSEILWRSSVVTDGSSEDIVARNACDLECRRINGLRLTGVDPEVLADIDAQE